MKGRPVTSAVDPGQILFRISNAAFLSRHELDMERQKICAVCGSGFTYTKNQKYMTKNGPKTSKSLKEEWYKYGKYSYMCKRCYNVKWKQRKMMQGMIKL